jgi:hypothetical protein
MPSANACPTEEVLRRETIKCLFKLLKSAQSVIFGLISPHDSKEKVPYRLGGPLVGSKA